VIKMAITVTPSRTGNIPNVIGDRKVAVGKFTTELTGGNINTGLEVCEAMVLVPSGNTLVTAPPSVVSALPAPGDSITILSPHGTDGIYIAYGH